MDDFIIQHPLGGGIAGAGVGPGEQDESGVGARTGTEAHTGTVVGLLDRKASRQRHVRRKTSKAKRGPATTPTPHPVRLMPPPNLLPRRRDEERERERVCMRARERQTEKDRTKPPILLSHWWLAP